ncbi:MAG: AtpZ/AtpI family protein [Planctomycetota bacterium]
MTNSPDDRSPLAEAAAWGSRVTAIALEMALPGLLGYWADQRFDTGPLFLIVGGVLGLGAGMWQLIVLSKECGSEDRRRPTERGESADNDSEER